MIGGGRNFCSREIEENTPNDATARQTKKSQVQKGQLCKTLE